MVSGAGTIYFGSAYDTNLYRPSANKLQTDGALDAKGGFTVNGAPIGNIAYQGAYSASQTYHDGDIVVGADGITYQCVKEGTVGITPAPWSAPPPSPIPYGTTLPTVTYDGMEAILVDSVTNPSYQWRFRYNAQSTSAYKWEFVGGTPVQVVDNTTQSPPSASTWSIWGAPSFNVPRAGEYLVTLTQQLYSTSQIQLYYGISIGGANPVGFLANGAITVPYGEATWVLPNGIATLTSGQAIQTGTWAQTTGAAQSRIRTLIIQPKRVS
jgi:hypothetical protein